MTEPQTIKFPIPALPETAYTAKKGKRRKTLAEKEERRKETDKARFKSRIYIGMAFPRWRELREEKNFQTDTDLALYLLDCHDDRSVISAPSKFGYKPPGLPPLSTIEAESISDRDEDILSDAEELDDVQIEQVETSDFVNVCSAEINIDEYNDIRNTVIDWNHDALNPVGANECNSPEERVTSLCVRTSGEMSPQMCIESLLEISLEETVHGPIQSDETGPTGTEPFIPNNLEILCEDDVVGHRASITYHDSLKQLATQLILPVKTCPAKDPSTQVECKASQPFELKIKSWGTAAIMEWVCPNGHTVWKWSSQPLMKSGMQIGDFMLAMNILLSGNNYRMVALLLRNMNMGMVDHSIFSHIQDSYCVETIKAFWEEKRRDTIARERDKNRVVLGDCRLSSPGQGVTCCTCIAMDNDTKEILSIVTMDNVQTQQNSAIIEKDAFIQTIDKLKQEIPIQEVCTGAHRQISTLFSKGKYKESGIIHSWDIWSGVENLGKMLQTAGQSRGCFPILYWIKDICNHFWCCCKEADTYEEFMSLWVGILHHVTDEHEWATGACHHGPLSRSQNNIWIERDSVAHATLISVIMNQSWLRDVEKFLPFRSTADLESFHDHVLMYVSERFSFSPSAYEARVLLAGLDYNHHVHKPAIKNRDGILSYRKVWSKKSNRWRLYTVKVPKDYSYIPDLQSAILRRWLTDDKGTLGKRGKRSSDPGAPGVPEASCEPKTTGSGFTGTTGGWIADLSVPHTGVEIQWFCSMFADPGYRLSSSVDPTKENL